MLSSLALELRDFLRRRAVPSAAGALLSWKRTASQASRSSCLAELGHTIRKPRPALVPLTSEDTWVKELAGITIPDVRLRALDPLGMIPVKRRLSRLPKGVLLERRGSLLFTHFGLSGPAVLD